MVGVTSASPERTSSPCWFTHTVRRRTRLRGSVISRMLNTRRDEIPGPDGLQELQGLRQIDRAGTGQTGPITAEISPAVKMPGAMGALNGVVAA
jgi:hypothetical protein